MAKTKIVILEGTTELTNAELANFCRLGVSAEDSEGQPYFKLTQKPKVRVARPVKVK